MLIDLLKNRAIPLVVLVFLLALLFIGGHQPESAGLFPSPWDKLAHFFFYALLTLIAGISFPAMHLHNTVLLGILVGCLDEFHQTFVIGRQPGIDDLIADAGGAIFAICLLPFIRSKISLTPR